MAQHTVTINNRSYTIACDDGQEDHLTRLAQFLDQKVQGLAGSLGQVGDTRLLVIAGILISDELSDACAEVEALRAEKEALEKRLQRSDDPQDGTNASATNTDAAAESLNVAAADIESLVAKLSEA